MLRCRHTSSPAPASDPALCPSSHLIVLVEVVRVEAKVVRVEAEVVVVEEAAHYGGQNCVVVRGAEACERE